MPTQINRTSLDTNLESRFEKSTSGVSGASKKALGNVGKTPQSGQTVNHDSKNSQLYAQPPGFVVKQMVGITSLADAIDSNASPSSRSKELSRYVKGFSSRKYKG